MVHEEEEEQPDLQLVNSNNTLDDGNVCNSLSYHLGLNSVYCTITNSSCAGTKTILDSHQDFCSQTRTMNLCN